MQLKKQKHGRPARVIKHNKKTIRDMKLIIEKNMHAKTVNDIKSLKKIVTQKKYHREFP